MAGCFKWKVLLPSHFLYSHIRHACTGTDGWVRAGGRGCLVLGDVQSRERMISTDHTVSVYVSMLGMCMSSCKLRLEFSR
jgi:hypothetical protein